MRVRWTRPASRHLEEIGEYIARVNPAASNRATPRILDQVDMLGDHPHIGRPGRADGTRELVISDTPYIAVYRVWEREVEIVAVFHAARRWPDKFD
jgi:addiction module RelE/StbE family toxin